jgi:ribosomal protein S27AE
MGLVVAVPLVLVALIAAFLVFRGGGSPRQRNSRCPYCGAQMTTASHIAELNCPSCNRRVEFRNGVILRAE